MGYTFKNAKEDFFNYLGISPENVTCIPNSKDFGIELQNPDTNEKCVIFISAVGRNTSSPKMYFDTRDSYPKERIITRKYARENNLKFFFLGLRNEDDCKIKDFFISLEANESQIQANSGKASVNSTERGGNQVNLPSTFTYKKKTERLKSDKGFYFSAIHKDKLWDYMTYFDNRPYEETLQEEVQMNMENGVSLNRIIFGAPGTGKSHRLDEEAKAFEKQEQVKIDIESQIKDEIASVIKLSGKLNFLAAIGVKYSDILSKKKKEQLKNDYNLNGIDELYVASRAKEIAAAMKIDEEADDKESQIKKLVEDAKSKDNMLQNLTAIGLKFSDYLSESTMPSLKETYSLTSDAQMWWLYRGAQAGQLVTKGKKKENVKFLERVTFHPNYSYAQFVGTYKPAKSKVKMDEITYEYIPGPFMRVYANAVKELKRATACHEEPKKFLLLIEEINRANVAAVFGDVFQLLDRKNGSSQYPIAASEDQKVFLESVGINDDEISIPSNMYIWATMNSADQGVLPMDAAFKRRWDFEYLGIDDNQVQISTYVVPYKCDGSESFNWNDFRVKLNEKLAVELKINEDKQLGPFFMNENSLKNATSNPEKFVKLFESKVLMYLFEDVVKMNPKKLFSNCGEDLRYSKICEQWELNGPAIFNIDCEILTSEAASEK